MNDYPQAHTLASEQSAEPQGKFEGSFGSRLCAVINQAQDQLQTFFDELKNGTTNYQTVTSLSGQIAQEYRGRCILELLQNAHDALADAGEGDPRKISFVLISSPEPVLLIGNSGRPFLRKDFKGICQLGQSPKDPNKSVGNKGLGFRSVLEVCSSPEIWSTPPAVGEDAFVFRFDPAVCDSVAMAAADLSQRGLDARSPFDESRPLLDWSSEQLAQYHERLSSGLDVAKEAREFLSPYLLPLPIKEIPPEVERLLNKGFKTIIRLRLDGGRDGDRAGAIQTVKEQLQLLDERATVFLANLKTLELSLDEVSRTFERRITSETQLSTATRVHQQCLAVTCTPSDAADSKPREFQVWSHTFGGDHDAEAQCIREKVQHLPNRWPELRTATVGIAVEDTTSPTDGVFVIFLPTTMGTGTRTLINAPFYGSLDRRQIDFKDHYNRLLIDWILDLCLDVITDLAAGAADDRNGRAIVDLLASTELIGDAGNGWSFLKRLLERSKERDGILDELPLVHCDGGWCAAKDARIMPSISDDSHIESSIWRESAGFHIVSQSLNGRHKAVTAIIEAMNGSRNPSPVEWCKTIQIVAAQVKAEKVKSSWDEFLRSVVLTLPSNLRNWTTPSKSDPLAECEFIPTQDGRLLSVTGGATIFFQPVQGADDAADLVGDVPKALESAVAFLHPDVITHEGTQHSRTDVQKFLEDRFVRGFSRIDLLRKVVLPALPELPTSHDSEEGRRCVEIFSWALEIVSEKGSTTLESLIKHLPVACHGGWRSMEEAVFGPGWEGRLGDCLWDYSSELPEDCAIAVRDSALLPPNDPRWGTSVAGRGHLFNKAGVLDGLRLQPVSEFQFGADCNNHELPKAAPDGFPVEVWNKWRQGKRNTWRPYHDGWFSYEIAGIFHFPGMPFLEGLSTKGIEALSRLLFVSFSHWPSGWEFVTIDKVSGQKYPKEIPSPLHHWLSSNTWLSDRSRIDQPLKRRWLIPAYLLDEQRYAHLDPLPIKIAQSVESDLFLRKTLIGLGLNIYPVENNQIGPELLNSLAASWKARRVPIERFDPFIGQLRAAWKNFDPTKGLPRGFLTWTGQRKLTYLELDQLQGVFLPDHKERTRALMDHHKPILEMNVVDAHRLVGPLREKTEIRQASKLEERILINGASRDAEMDGVIPLEQSGYAWLSPVILAVAAHGGSNPAGTATKAWNEAAGRLQTAYLLLCESIEVQLIDGEEEVASSHPDAWWLPDGVLAIRRDAELAYDKLAPALQTALSRRDLIKDLRLILKSLAGIPSPTLEVIEQAMEDADIDAQSLADVRQGWMGSVSIIIDRIRPVLALMGVSEEGLDAAGIDIERLREWLDSRINEWSAEDLLSTARRCRTDRAMGEAAWLVLGDRAQLPAWNDVLGFLGDRYSSVENRVVKHQVDAYLDQVSPLLSALARDSAIKSGKSGLFLEMESARHGFKAPAEWKDQWWEVPFQVVLCALHAEYAKLDALGDELRALTEPKSVHEFRVALGAMGIAVDPDPYELAADNKEAFSQALLKLHDFRKAWKEKTEGSSTVEEPPKQPADLDPSAYLMSWPESKLIEKSQHLFYDPGFKSACEGCSTLDEIRVHLGIDAATVEAHRKERLKLEQEAEREKRTFEVAGSSFEVGTGSYKELFDGLKSLAPPVGPRAIDDEFTPLKVIGPGRAGGGGGGTGAKLSSRRPSKELTELLGIVGEMHAYRFLQKEFGKESVRRSSWVSELSLKVLPHVAAGKDEIYDGLGFDFKFRCGKKTWHVEAKATQGDDSQFELGTSEIRAASRQAGSPDQPWRILRITNALSAEPTFEWLPNPFEKGGGQHYRLQQGGMRVSYARSKT
ncbi:sacsin N-terminal ATP-binding-like domain-containing protein [Haloferula sp.]|uniref:sacsin N-terminal ATP-binding-like domain-containing protein n=1 Tax=Haloferula sp. TaxID=2497595 RepID=UPI003C780C6F